MSQSLAVDLGVPGTGVDLLVGQAGLAVSECSALWVPGLLSGHWCAGLGPGHSGGQGNILGQL